MAIQRSGKLLTYASARHDKAVEPSGWRWKKAGAVLMLCVASAIASTAQTFKALHAFNGTNGANPYAGLTQGTDGNLYGTTIDAGPAGAGNIFKITPSGKLVSIYTFCAQNNCPDGQYPVTVLTLGADGSFYGTTQSGGTLGGYGTVYKITPSGTLTVVHSFNGADGAGPYGSLVLGSNGDLYGTVDQGGPSNSGFVYKVTPAGTFTTLYGFCKKSGCLDGADPLGQLIQASDGNYYGVTHVGGGGSACPQGCGTVFKITPSGTLTTLHIFNQTDGEYPYGGVVEGLDGMFYGTAAGGGANNFGTVFKMTPSGTLTTLHSFDDTDGAGPYAMSLGSDGNFYGTTSGGGPDEAGTLFTITPSGAFTTLHIFDRTDGRMLNGGLVQRTDGTFYGDTYFGGPDDDGILFSEDVGLGPFVAFIRTSGKVGQVGGILGQGLTGTTAVSINGTPASFKVVSDTFLEATVPAGATTGYVTVTTPSGALTSNVPFYVLR